MVDNADDAGVMAWSEALTARRVLFSPSGTIAEGFVVERDRIVRRTSTASEPLIPLADVELTGRHLLNNVIAAAAVASIAGVTPQAMSDALHGFRGLEHVMEPVAQVGGVRFVNDSKATNVEAARRSIESFTQVVATGLVTSGAT